MSRPTDTDHIFSQRGYVATEYGYALGTLLGAGLIASILSGQAGFTLLAVALGLVVGGLATVAPARRPSRAVAELAAGPAKAARRLPRPRALGLQAVPLRAGEASDQPTAELPAVAIESEPTLVGPPAPEPGLAEPESSPQLPDATEIASPPAATPLARAQALRRGVELKQAGDPEGAAAAYRQAAAGEDRLADSARLLLRLLADGAQERRAS
jgi:hypothetical protein